MSEAINKEFYDDVYRDPHQRHSFEVRAKLFSCLSLMARCGIDPNGKKLLDFGFGSGSLLRAIGEAYPGCQRFGVELSASAAAGLDDPGVQATVLKDNRIPYDNASFDVVVASHVIEHLEDDMAAIREFARCLRPGGWLIVGVPSSLAAPSPVHLRNYTTLDQQKFRECGFTVACEHYYGSPLFLSLILGSVCRLAALFSGTPPAVQVPASAAPVVGAPVASYSLLRRIYHTVVVSVLLVLYRIDAVLAPKKGLELWWVLKKESSPARTNGHG